MDYINGNKFAEIADFVIDLDNTVIDFNLSENAILYCKTDFLEQLFEHIQYSDKKYILISHMSDRPINEKRFKSKPNCVKKWFAENAIYDHPDLISIPLGLENHVPGHCKGLFTNHEWLINNIERLKGMPKDMILYCNWRTYVDRRKRNKGRVARTFVVDQLKQTNLKLFTDHIFTDYRLPFEEYCDNMAQHTFVVCPPGYGVDTHRMWEALYMGCYPIVIKHRIYRDYDLPIIQVNDYSEVNMDLLNEFLEKKYSYEMLNMSYWKNKIENYEINLFTKSIFGSNR